MPVEFRLISVQDYHRMAEAKIFRPDERVELIDGQLIPMAAKGTAHSAAITRINRLLKSRLGDRVLLRLQDPIELDNYSEPEPDIALVKPDSLDYEDHHPTVSEVFLMISGNPNPLVGWVESAAVGAMSGNSQFVINLYWSLTHPHG